MKQPKILHYTVVGKGSFPLDMLRYDSCWPEDPQDVFLISRELDTATAYVHLRGLQCTPARWESFGWAVMP